jgi:hypothetical protein
LSARDDHRGGAKRSIVGRIGMREQKSPVIFTGENPGLTLYAPGGERIAVAASYWRCTFSEYGEGNALIFCVDTPDLGTWQAIYADNAAMGRFVTDTLTQHFGDFKELGLPSVAVRPGRFFQESDSRRYHRVVCHAEDRAIELVWRDVRDRQLLQVSDMVLGAGHFDLSTVICPCGAASITLDDAPIPGEVRESVDANGKPSSSAFLAFAEAWVQR